MPLYEYECEACGARFEIIQRFSDSPIEACRQCGKPVHKLISPPSIQFKGTGWYITDYARKSSGGHSTSSSSSSSSPTSESSRDTKTESSAAGASPGAKSNGKKD